MTDLTSFGVWGRLRSLTATCTPLTSSNVRSTAGASTRMQSNVSRTTDARGTVDDEDADEEELDVDDLGVASVSFDEMGMWRATRRRSRRVCTERNQIRYSKNRADYATNLQGVLPTHENLARLV